MSSMFSSPLTAVHTLISLVALIAGLAALGELLRARTPATLTAVFLATTILTSATGFLFRSAAIGPPHVVGAISLAILAVACYAYYGRRLQGPWRRAYVVTAVTALYLNAFVGVVQAFQKIPALTALAPTQAEPPFLIAQAATLLLFAGLGLCAARRHVPASAR